MSRNYGDQANSGAGSLGGEIAGDTDKSDQVGSQLINKNFT